MLKNIYIFLFVYIIVNTIYSETVSAYIYTNSIEMGKGYSKSTSSVETLPSEIYTLCPRYSSMPESSEKRLELRSVCGILQPPLKNA